jgi:hypothetical protein
MSTLAKFRISSHSLKIEKGRHARIPLTQRLCITCSEGEVEDEIHFMWKCKKYEDIRLDLSEHFNKKSHNFPQLNEKNKLSCIQIYVKSHGNQKIIFYSFIHSFICCKLF